MGAVDENGTRRDRRPNAHRGRQAGGHLADDAAALQLERRLERERRRLRCTARQRVRDQRRRRPEGDHE